MCESHLAYACTGISKLHLALELAGEFHLTPSAFVHWDVQVALSIVLHWDAWSHLACSCTRMSMSHSAYSCTRILIWTYGHITLSVTWYLFINTQNMTRYCVADLLSAQHCDNPIYLAENLCGNNRAGHLRWNTCLFQNGHHETLFWLQFVKYNLKLRVC